MVIWDWIILLSLLGIIGLIAFVCVRGERLDEENYRLKKKIGALQKTIDELQEERFLKEFIKEEA